MLNNRWVAITIVSAICAVLTFVVYSKCRSDFTSLQQHYREVSGDKSQLSVQRIEDSFNNIYQNLRTISFLPSVRRIDRHGTNITTDDRLSIQQIYNNLATSVAVSEVYIVPADIKPDRIDPFTKELEAPILMFDELIVNNGAKKEQFQQTVTHGAEFKNKEVNTAAEDKPNLSEVEIYEYRAFHKMFEKMRVDYPNISAIKGLELPFVSTPEVITCDNSAYARTMQDKDRKGIIFAVPFFGMKGELKGVVAAIILTNALKDLLPGPDYAIVNPSYNYTVTPNTAGQEIASLKWVERAQADPSLIYSSSAIFNKKDPWGEWFLWAGHANAQLLESESAEAIRNFEYSWYAFIAAFGVLATVLWVFLGRWVTAVEAAGRAKNDFLANMSHELRTPLNNIIGSIQIIPERKMEESDRELFSIIEKASRSLLSIVNDILDLSKIEAGEVRLEHISFDTFEKIRDVCQMFLPLASQKGISLFSTLEGENIYVLGDPLRFERILTNLIGNALRYTEKGSVRVAGRLKITGPGSALLRCEITDTGIGIAKEKQKNIFDRFSQADSSTSRKYGGTGLGLAITRQLVDLMHGDMGIDSEVGKGSTFWFELQLQTTKEAPHAKASNKDEALVYESAIPVEHARVLVAEDHELNRAFMRRLLESLGIKDFAFANNGRLALEAVSQRDYDIVLMDCHMPEMDGYDATREIRNLPSPRISTVPIVAMTANAMPHDKERCLAAGMNAYISKPFEVSTFKRTLAPWIRFRAVEAAAPSLLDADSTPDAPANLKVLMESALNNPENVKEMVSLFFVSAEELMAALKSAGEYPDAAVKWYEAAHGLKGLCSVVGAERLRQLAAQAQLMQGYQNKECLNMIQLMDAEYILLRQFFNEKGLI